MHISTVMTESKELAGQGKTMSILSKGDAQSVFVVYVNVQITCFCPLISYLPFEVQLKYHRSENLPQIPQSDLFFLSLSTLNSSTITSYFPFFRVIAVMPSCLV